MVLSKDLPTGMKLDHIGIAVKSLTAAREVFENKLGGLCLSQKTIDSQKLVSAKIKIGETDFELMEGTSVESVINKFIVNRGEGVHHLSFQVPDLEKAVQQIKAMNMEVGQVTSGEGYKVAFIHPRSIFGILIELFERI